MTSGTIVEGTVVDSSLHPEHGKAEVTLEIECSDGVTFEETYDMAFNMARAQEFSHRYGKLPDSAEDVRVNVYTGDNHNPRHTLRSLPPLKTIGGRTLVGEDVELPVEMN